MIFDTRHSKFDLLQCCKEWELTAENNWALRSECWAQLSTAQWVLSTTDTEQWVLSTTEHYAVSAEHYWALRSECWAQLSTAQWVLSTTGLWLKWANESNSQSLVKWIHLSKTNQQIDSNRNAPVDSNWQLNYLSFTRQLVSLNYLSFTRQLVSLQAKYTSVTSTVGVWRSNINNIHYTRLRVYFQFTHFNVFF